MSEKFPLHSILQHFDSFETFLEGLLSTEFVQNAAPKARADLMKAAGSAVDTLIEQFPEGFIQKGEHAKEILSTFDQRLEPFVLAMAGRSFLTLLSMYTDASLCRKALAACVGDITAAMIEHLPPDVVRANPVVIPFVKKVYEATQKLKSFISSDDCECAYCQASTDPITGKVEVKTYDENDPTVPQSVKDAIEHIKMHGDAEGLPKGMSFAIDFTKPETWDEELAKLPFPEEAKVPLLAQLRREYRKATGKCAPGDPAISNN